MATLNFNAKDHKPLDVVEAVPTGWYPVKITASEVKENSSGTGEYLKLTGTILAGDFKGNVLFTNLNISHPNPVAVDIANRQLSSICHAIDVMVVKDSSVLHNKPHMWKAVYVGPVIDEDGEQLRAAKNDIKGYKALDIELVNEGITASDDDAPAWVTEDDSEDDAVADMTAADKKLTDHMTNNDDEQVPDVPAKPAPKKIALVKKAPAKKSAPKRAPAKKDGDIDYDKFLTDKANGISYAAFVEKGWTVEALIKSGYMEDPGAGEAPAIPDIPDAPGVDEQEAAPTSKPPWVPD